MHPHSTNHNAATWLNGLQTISRSASGRRHSTASGHHPLGPQVSDDEPLLHAAQRTSSATRRKGPEMPVPPPPLTLGQQAFAEIKAFFLDTKMNVMLIFAPIAIISGFAGWGDAATFVLAMLGLIPLAERLGFVTEQLAMYTNDTLGGLLNATFGNATEVIICGFALRDGFLRLVQLSLLGSVVSNLLLVMGTAFVAGGIKNPSQKFNQEGINVNCGLLLLAVVAILLPSLLSETHTSSRGTTSELALSRFESLLLLGCYALYLVFQLVTHKHLFQEVEQDPPLEAKAKAGADKKDDNRSARTTSGPPAALSKASSKRHGNVEMAPLSTQSSGHPWTVHASNEIEADGRNANGDVEAAGGLSHRSSHSALGSRPHPQADGTRNSTSDGGSEAGSEGSEEEEKVLSKIGCFVWLTLVTVVIAVLSELIVDAVKGASKALKLPMPFITTILLPIVGNAAEHASAVYFAYKNRIEIALGVALGSSTQVSVLIIPFCVILAWMMGQPLDLNFNGFEAMVLFISVLLAVVVVQDGRSNWLKGVLLLLTYFFISAGFWAHKDADLSLKDIDAA